MRKVFESPQQEIVGHYQSILDSHEIPTMLKNGAESAVLGTAFLKPSGPELWVMRDEDYDRAMEILRPYYEGS